jgi:hypothetical protein
VLGTEVNVSIAIRHVMQIAHDSYIETSLESTIADIRNARYILFFVSAGQAEVLQDPSFTYGQSVFTVPLSRNIIIQPLIYIQGCSNMTGTNCDLFTHK